MLVIDVSKRKWDCVVPVLLYIEYQDPTLTERKLWKVVELMRINFEAPILQVQITAYLLVYNGNVKTNFQYVTQGKLM